MAGEICLRNYYYDLNQLYKFCNIRTIKHVGYACSMSNIYYEIKITYYKNVTKPEKRYTLSIIPHIFTCKTLDPLQIIKSIVTCYSKQNDFCPNCANHKEAKCSI